MKRTWINMIMVLILLFLTACNSNNHTTTVKYGTYVLEQIGTEAVAFPKVTISGDDILFTYDGLSSYLPFGTYTIENDILTMITNDRKYKYVFQIDGDKLVFQENESAKVNLTDNRFGIKITDNSEFKLKEN